MSEMQTTPMVASMLCVPYQTLHDWIPLVLPDRSAGRGCTVRWSPTDVVLAAVVRELRDAGMPADRIRTAVAALRRRRDLARLRLVVVGDQVHAVRTDRDLARALRGNTGVAVDVRALAATVGRGLAA